MNWVLALLFAVLFVRSRRRDRRLLRTGLYLLAAGWFALLGSVGWLAAVVPGFSWLLLVLLALLPLAVLVLAVFGIGNGVTMLRREGRSTANVLSLAAGVALLALPGVAVGLFLLRSPVAIAAGALVVFTCSYLGVVFVAFLVFTAIYGRGDPLDRPPGTVVVLGSGLVNGQVPPLLRSRLDKAIALYQEARAAGSAPLLIPSGGQGVDESRSEGSAMRDYLVEHGVNPADVLAEEYATNTRSNLLLSRDLQQAAGRGGPTVVVTNNYHVPRAALIARSVGTDAQVVGSPTARYYVPSAYLREFVAVVVAQRTRHLALLALPFLAVTGTMIVELAPWTG